jgi:hypothetical protein
MGQGKFAQETGVPVDRTMSEIRLTITKYGAGKIMTYEDADRVILAFEMRNRQVKFVMPLPQRKDYKYTTGGRHGRVGDLNPNGYEQAVRTRWRCLLLTIRAKLESVEIGIETFDEAFMAQIVLPGGKTMGEWAVPQIEIAYEKGTMPPLLLSSGGDR